MIGLNRNIILSVFIVSFAVIGTGAYFYFNKGKLSTENNTQVEVVTDNNDVNVVSDNPNYKIEVIPMNKVSTPVPDLDRRVNFEKLDAKSKSTVEETIKLLKSDSSKTLLWIELGTWRKFVEDYEGARIAWEYAAAISPTSPIAFINLGDLYHYYLKDYKKAEDNFLRAVNSDARFTDGYLRLFKLYTESYKMNTSAAPDILKRGIENNPSAQDLIFELASYYKKNNNLTEAKVYYNKALDLARKDGNTALENEIKQVLSTMQ